MNLPVGTILDIEGAEYEVKGSNKLRGRYYYVLRGPQGKVSLDREVFLEELGETITVVSREEA